MLGKPDRYQYTDPIDLMKINPREYPLQPSQYRLTDFKIPAQQRGDLERPQVVDAHIYQPINQIKLHNSTVKKLNPLDVMKAYNQPRMVNYIKYYDPQHLTLNSLYQQRYQGYEAYGKPYTTYLRLFTIYTIGFGVAMRQGYYGLRFWRFHYFDWMRFIKLGAIFGYGGAGLVGMGLWGDPDLAFARFRSKLGAMQYDDPYTMDKNCSPTPRI